MSQTKGVVQLVLVGPVLLAVAVAAAWFTVTGVVVAFVAWPGLLVIAVAVAAVVHTHTRHLAS